MEEWKRWALVFGPGGLEPGERRTFDGMNGGHTLYRNEIAVNSGDSGIVIEAVHVGGLLQEPPAGKQYPFEITEPEGIKWPMEAFDGVAMVRIVVRNTSDKDKMFYLSLIGKIKATA